MQPRAPLALALLPSVLVLAGCGGGGDLPQRANIRVNGMLVGVSTTGLDWDGLGAVAAALQSDLVRALASSTPYATAVAVVGEIAARVGTATAAPDAAVLATLYVDGSPTESRGRTDGDANNDSFFPTFSSLSWDGVPLAASADVRLRIDVADEDLTDYEPICVAEIGFASILDALEAGTATQVRVAEQCGNQLLFITLSVTEMR